MMHKNSVSERKGNLKNSNKTKHTCGHTSLVDGDEALIHIYRAINRWINKYSFYMLFKIIFFLHTHGSWNEIRYLQSFYYNIKIYKFLLMLFRRTPKRSLKYSKYFVLFI